MGDTALAWMSLREAAQRLAQGEVSPVELTRACLERIAALDGRVNAFITITAESALEEARRAEAELRRGARRGPLHGIPIALKDLVDTAGVRTTAASAVFQDRIPQQDAEVVRRLRQVGAVLIGKTNLHEFAYGGSGLISHFGPVRNPWDVERVTGGSSSGSAAAVAAGFCFAAIGTDTAGSIRLPAACCGVVGLKPTYGRVSTRGVIPLSWSYDHVGPIARTVADCALVLQAIAGYDPEDVTSRELPAEDYETALQRPLNRLRVGVGREFFFAELDGGIEARVDLALQRVGALVAEVRDVRIAVDTDRTASSCESYAYHAPLLEEHEGLYLPETLRRIRSGAAISAADYIAARQRLEQQRRAATSLFREVDVLLTPTTPIPPPAIAELEAHPERVRSLELTMLRNTRPFNVLGLPTISVPCGFSPEGLPVGLQISGPPGCEAVVLALAHAYEQATGWHGRRPSIGIGTPGQVGQVRR